MEEGIRSYINELRQDKISRYHSDYPQIMRVLRPELLMHIPVVSASRKYLDVLLRCEACLLLSEDLEARGDSKEARGDSKEARDIRRLVKSSLSALSAVDSCRALYHFREHGRLPRGWKVPQLPFLEIKMQPALRDGDTGKKISELEGLWDRGRAKWLRQLVEQAEECITVCGRYGASVWLVWRS